MTTKSFEQFRREIADAVTVAINTAEEEVHTVISWTYFDAAIEEALRK